MRRLPFLLSLLLAACQGAEEPRNAAERFEDTEAAIRNKAAAIEAKAENEVAAVEAELENEVRALRAAAAGNATDNVQAEQQGAKAATQR